jgi:hypothetical protein
MTIVDDFGLDTVFAKGMAACGKNPRESLLRIVNAAEGT